MKQKIILTTVLLSIVLATVLYILMDDFKFNTSKILSSNNKKNSVTSIFNKNYNLSYSISSDDKFEEEIKKLTKKTTYLLLGDPSKRQESSEDYYKRKEDWRKLRYNPKIPKDDSNPLGLDTKSQEYIDNVLSGTALPQIFNQVTELELQCESYGDIHITKNNDIVISSIILPKSRIKEQSKEDPMKYDYIETDFIMNYYYKKLNNEWKLYYLYGESSDDISEYFNNIETTESKTINQYTP